MGHLVMDIFLLNLQQP